MALPPRRTGFFANGQILGAGAAGVSHTHLGPKRESHQTFIFTLRPSRYQPLEMGTMGGCLAPLPLNWCRRCSAQGSPSGERDSRTRLEGRLSLSRNAPFPWHHELLVIGSVDVLHQDHRPIAKGRVSSKLPLLAERMPACYDAFTNH